MKYSNTAADTCNIWLEATQYVSCLSEAVILADPLFANKAPFLVHTRNPFLMKTLFLALMKTLFFAGLSLIDTYKGICLAWLDWIYRRSIWASWYCIDHCSESLRAMNRTPLEREAGLPASRRDPGDRKLAQRMVHVLVMYTVHVLD